MHMPIVHGNRGITWRRPLVANSSRMGGCLGSSVTGQKHRSQKCAWAINGDRVGANTERGGVRPESAAVGHSAEHWA